MEYKVLSTLKHNGDLFQIGETVEMSEKAFHKLPDNTVEPLETAKEKAKAKK